MKQVVLFFDADWRQCQDPEQSAWALTILVDGEGRPTSATFAQRVSRPQEELIQGLIALGEGAVCN